MKQCLEKSWRQLALIKFECSMFRPQRLDLRLDLYKECSTMQLVANLVSYQTNTCTEVAQLVKPKEQLAEHYQQQRISAAFSHLQGPEWRCTSSLTITIYTNQGADIIAQLVQLDLPCLRFLHLSDSSLGSAAMQYLAKGAWRQLRRLDVSHNLIDQAAMAALIQGDWPELEELNLASNPLLDATAIALIPKAASWSTLFALNLQGVNLAVAGFHALTQIPGVKHMLLDSTGLRLADVSQPSLVSWPYVSRLVLTNNKLGSSDVIALIAASMPNLHTLDLDSNSLDAVAAARLTEGKWPHLAWLCLKDNDLTDDAVAALAKCQWPTFECLHLVGNNIRVCWYRYRYKCFKVPM